MQPRTYLRPKQQERAKRECAIVVAREEAGVVRFTVRDAEVIIEWMELAPERRGWGHGSEAVRLLEEQMAGEGVKRVRALVPVENGLALYFWLRLGYLPAAAGDADWPPTQAADSITMVRGSDA